MKIWMTEELINVLCNLEDYWVLVKHLPAKPSLPSLLLKEAQQGHTREQDPVATRPDFYYFPHKAAFIMVEDVIQEFKPIIVKEYARPKTREATAWPVMWLGTEGKSAFSNYTSKQSLLHVRNQIGTMLEHYIKEFNIQNLNQPNPEQFNKTLESEKKEIAKKTDSISVHPDPTASKAETPAQNFCRTTPGNQAIFKVKSRICNLFISYLDEQGFIEIHTPKIQGAATESGASVFKLQYFDQTAFLAQSPQLAIQMAITADFERVYEIGPVFRAENSNTY
ncbi:hypothetical protein PPACK8108_LOCUS7703 [Phakopsora pachyrhizi]|uniref:aspartate--tRNA ligase n=1 Tax=Phakopsora pachyrhizi TaxID=170000 RepID=A0AAV0ATX1_PHAPC|nr:hypothetical protein PPACK8108_LOCUS7703 [Phakopsora pachyrhizi]